MRKQQRSSSPVNENQKHLQIVLDYLDGHTITEATRKTGKTQNTLQKIKSGEPVKKGIIDEMYYSLTWNNEVLPVT